MRQRYYLKPYHFTDSKINKAQYANSIDEALKKTAIMLENDNVIHVEVTMIYDRGV